MNRNHDQEEHSTNFRMYLPEAFRRFIEDRFYSKIGEKARLEEIKEDPTFLKNPDKHIGLYSDHSTVHVRDVSRQVLSVIERVNGVLIPRREHGDLEFMRAYSLHLAYLHDIGMVDLTEFGRFMHPEFAAQFVFHPDFDEQFELLWAVNSGNLPWQLLSLFKKEKTEFEIKRIFREMLTLSVGHSKSKMPIRFINEPAQLRRHLQTILSTPLSQLYLQQKALRMQAKLKQANTKKDKEKWEKKLEKQQKKIAKALSESPADALNLQTWYQDFPKESFAWLEGNTPGQQKMTQNVLDGLRCIRSADALRQRGTELRTSAGYEVFVDQRSANAIFALRSADSNELYLLEGKKPINAGEANLASSEIDYDGNLRVSFHRGRFRNGKVIRKAAYNAAFAINDIQGDTIQSFLRDNQKEPKGLFPKPRKTFAEIKILIEGVDDNPEFSELVVAELKKLNPVLEKRLKATTSLGGADLIEVERYLGGQRFDHFFAPDEMEGLLRKIASSGLKCDRLKDADAFYGVKVIRVNAGEKLIQSGSVSGFVYIPMTDGLQVFPLGGYDSKAAPAWVPIGNTGVIRGSIRNATVYAESTLELLAIPKEIYLRFWYAPYHAKSLGKAWEERSAKK